MIKDITGKKVFLFMALLLFLIAPAMSSAQQANNETLEGTFWTGTNSEKDSFVIEFLISGELRYTSANGTASKGTWKLKGNDFVIILNNRFSKLNARIAGDQLVGDAITKKGKKWNWTAIKQQALVLTQDAPKYPPLARAAMIEKTVRVEAQVDATGAVSAVKVIEGHPLLNPACEASTKKWKFNPSTEAHNLRVVIISFIFRIPKDMKSKNQEVEIYYLSKYQVEIKAGIPNIQISYSIPNHH